MIRAQGSIKVFRIGKEVVECFFPRFNKDPYKKNTNKATQYHLEYILKHR